MALITGLPNFVGSAKPTASDFNNAAKAICLQINGAYFDVVSGKYLSVSGNLDTTNIAASAGFRNEQKAEPNSYYLLSGSSPSAAGLTAGTHVAAGSSSWYADQIPLGFVPVPSIITSIAVTGADTGTTYNQGIKGGYATIYINNSPAQQVTLPSTVLAYSWYPKPSVSGLNLYAQEGSLITVDYSLLAQFGQLSGAGFTGASIAVSVLCKAAHVQ